MKISIALATFDGERFLDEQIDSVLRQTRPPDEVVAVDDGSRDSTVSRLLAWARTAPFPVRVVETPENRGVKRAFERAIAATTGDLIFLADQDDVWLREKIERVVAALADRPSALMCIHDCVVVDERLRGERTKLGQIRAMGLEPERYLNGSCMAFRRALVPLLLPIPEAYPSHDRWVHDLVSALERRMMLDVPLQLYRRHDANASGGLVNELRPLAPRDLFRAYARADSLSACEARMARSKALRARLESIPPTDESVERARRAVAALDAEQRAIVDRMRVLSSRGSDRLVTAAAMWARGGYRHFSGWKSLVKDVWRGV